MREISASLIQVLIRKRQGDPYDQKNTDSVPYAYAGGALSSMPAQAAQDWMQSYHHIETMLGKAEEAYAAGDKEGAKKDRQ